MSTPGAKLCVIVARGREFGCKGSVGRLPDMWIRRKIPHQEQLRSSKQQGSRINLGERIPERIGAEGMMRRFEELAAVLLACAIPSAFGQGGPAPSTPIVVLFLPAEIPSEAVQIHYFMTGAFGGYGSFVRTKDKQQRYEIAADVDGKAATSFKVVA
ncbi:MAG: hypothetical protein WBQ94_09410, partial [Terracidiphilus sp.]